MRKARHTFVATGLVALLAVMGVTAAIAADPAPAPPPKVAFLANGIVHADALAAGPIAGQLGAPIYTTQPDVLPAGTADALTAYNPELVIVMGGSEAISDAVVTQVSTATGLPTVDLAPTPTTGVVRVAGDDRFETATIVADLLAAYAPAHLPVDGQAVDADLLDGKDSSSFALKSDIGAGGGDAETLDGKDSTDFLGTTAKATDADLLDGNDSTDFLGTTAKATDADLLDGNDSTDFLKSGDPLDADTLEGNIASSLSVQGYVQVKSETQHVDANQYGEATATCPAGTKPLGGGQGQGDGVPVFDYFRDGPSLDGTGWSVTAHNVSGMNDRTFWAFAICAVVNP